jgi:hypothetical protein
MAEDISEVLEEIATLAKTLRNSHKLCGPRKYEEKPRELKAYHEGRYFAGKDLWAMVVKLRALLNHITPQGGVELYVPEPSPTQEHVGIAQPQTPLGRDDVLGALQYALQHRIDLFDALRELVWIIDQAGLLNLSNGVQLGQTSWYVKASDRLEVARATLRSPLSDGSASDRVAADAELARDGSGTNKTTQPDHAPGEGGWLPIETATAANKHVLVLLDGQVCEARWNPRDGWWIATFNGQIWRHRRPSHWMPLPALPPPQTEGSAA